MALDNKIWKLILAEIIPHIMGAVQIAKAFFCLQVEWGAYKRKSSVEYDWVELSTFPSPIPSLTLTPHLCKK